jgi:hypothetical protein
LTQFIASIEIIIRPNRAARRAEVKRTSKKSAAVATPEANQTIDVAVETSSEGMLAKAKAAEAVAQEVPQAPAPKAEAAPAEKPFRFAKGTRLRFRTCDKTEGPLDREGEVTGHGPRWITISRVVTTLAGC